LLPGRMEPHRTHVWYCGKFSNWQLEHCAIRLHYSQRFHDSARFSMDDVSIS
jgi:hypothetical protein